MSSILLIDPAHEITKSLTEGCTAHPHGTHHDLLALFQTMDHETAMQVVQQCRAMSPLERNLVERTVIRVGLDTLPLYAGPQSHPRTEAALLTVSLMPVAMEITRSFYCPEMPMEAIQNDISLSSHCVHSVTNFLNDSIDAHAPVWRDASLARGRYLLEMCDSFTGQPDDETRWIGKNSIALASHVNALEDCKKVDRSFCETLLTTTTPLLDGIL